VGGHQIGTYLMRSSRSIDTRVARARRLRRDMTQAERKLWWKLRELSAGGSHFRRQATIGPYFADFACHINRIVIEIDGGQHGDGDGTPLGRDQRRDAYMRRNGYRVLRFWNIEVRENIEGVLTVISDVLKMTPPTPNPSPPQAGGGERRRPSLSRGG
jgi:very-short-patch-repair endonuclease